MPRETIMPRRENQCHNPLIKSKNRKTHLKLWYLSVRKLHRVGRFIFRNVVDADSINAQSRLALPSRLAISPYSTQNRISSLKISLHCFVLIILKVINESSESACSNI